MANVLARRRFEALAGYTRLPQILQFIQELEWYATENERLLGIVTVDRIDQDFGWLILARDERLRFRAIHVNTSLPTPDVARDELLAGLTAHQSEQDEAFYQGDSTGVPMDFFRSTLPDDRLHPLFRELKGSKKYSPARELIKPMMRFYEDADGNFVEQFQSTGFEPRLWELYLFATFVELGYAPSPETAVPDFIFKNPFGALGIEATTVNPPNSGKIELPQDVEAAGAYLENFVPIKLARVLRRKLTKSVPYWHIPEMAGLPLSIAVQDFHLPRAMQLITHAMTEYAFGVRHSIKKGKHIIERIDEHVWGDVREKSGFFFLPGAENISAIIINPQGTLNKFNRMGYLAEFGDPGIVMVRRGLARGELDPSDPRPKPFVHRVDDPDYEETWVEGMVVFHNPRARVPLPPEFILGAAHEFLEPDGSIRSLLPQFHPYLSETIFIDPGHRGA